MYYLDNQIAAETGFPRNPMIYHIGDTTRSIHTICGAAICNNWVPEYSANWFTGPPEESLASIMLVLFIVT